MTFLSSPDRRNMRLVKESSSFIIARRISSSLTTELFLAIAISLAFSNMILTFFENSVAGLWELPLPMLFITIDLKRS